MLAQLGLVLCGVLNFLQTYNGAVTAAATVFIGIYTYVLARVTGRQARLTREAIDLARQEFISTHRPHLKVRFVKMASPMPGAPLAISYEIVNVGQTNAEIVRNEKEIIVHVPGAIEPIRFSGGGDLNKPIPAGGRVLDSHSTGTPYRPEWNLTSPAGVYVVFRGTIEYRDANGVNRRTAFDTHRDPHELSFHPTDNPDYQYED